MSAPQKNSEKNFSVKKKRKKERQCHDFGRKIDSHSEEPRWTYTTAEEIFDTQIPSSSQMSENISKRSFKNCKHETSFSQQVTSSEAKASSSVRKKDHVKELGSSEIKGYQSRPGYPIEKFDGRSKHSDTNLSLKKHRCRPDHRREKSLSSPKKGNNEKGKLSKKSKYFVENSQSCSFSGKSQMPPRDKTEQKGKKYRKDTNFSDVAHRHNSNREYRSHKKKSSWLSNVRNHSGSSHLESKSPASVSGGAGNTSKDTDTKKNSAIKNESTERNNLPRNEIDMSTGGDSGYHCTRVRKIPGFYYDREKKRYFKILPGFSADGSWITSETIKGKEAEEKRTSLLKLQNPPKVLNGTSLSAVNILQLAHKGTWNTRQYTRFSTECRLQAMGITPTSVYEPSTDLQIAGITPMVQFVELDRSMSKVMVVLSSEQVSRIILGSISEKHGKKKELLLQEWQDVYIRNSASSQINSAKLINISEQQSSTFPGNLYVLFSWSGDYSNGVQLVKCPSEQDAVSYIGYRFESPGEVISSCSWSFNPRFPAHLCIGFGKEAEIIEILSTSRQRLDTDKKEVSSQVFAKEQPIIHLGLKHGYISSYDLRAPPQPVYSMYNVSPVKKKMDIFHGGCVCSISLLTDDNYLLASSSNGAIKLWDLRRRSVVREMFGHFNQYKSLPVHVDSSENFIYSVGQDHHTRLWSLHDGRHLKTIPSPVQPTSQTSAFFSLNWGGSGLPGMMVGAKSKLFWYPF